MKMSQSVKKQAIQRLNLRNPCHLLATGFGSGLSPWLPGTAGSLAALPFWYLLSFLPLVWYLAVLAVAALAGIALCRQAALDMGVHDHGAIVWDEFVGIWITMIVLPDRDWRWVAAGFVLFRFFDMLKPWPVCWFDRRVQGGAGIMLDDIVAGMIAAVLLYVAQVLLLR